MIIGLDSWVFWLILVGIFAIIEVSTVNLVSVWFAGGSLAALIASLLGAPVFLQVLIAVGVSGVMLALVLIFKPFDKFRHKQNVATNSDRMIGQTGLVLTEIDPIEATGTVKVLGQVWSAVTRGEERIAPDELVKVLGISGVKLIVEKSDEEREVK